MIDVGANVGMWSMAVAHHCPDVTVIAMEPDERLVTRFRRSLALNDHLGSRVAVLQRACGDRTGTVRFEPGPSHSPELGRLVESTSVGEVVELVRVDDVCAERGVRPSLVKIDVEGFEGHVLDGMTTLMQQGYPRVILLEAHGFGGPDDPQAFIGSIYARLCAHYAVVLRQDDDRFVPCEGVPVWQDREHFLASEPRASRS